MNATERVVIAAGATTVVIGISAICVALVCARRNQTPILYGRPVPGFQPARTSQEKRVLPFDRNRHFAALASGH
jgi:hypothetical protein